jgi:hypothetical protein
MREGGCHQSGHIDLAKPVPPLPGEPSVASTSGPTALAPRIVRGAGLAAVELSVGVPALLHLPGQPSVWAAMAANTASRAGDAGGVGGDHTRSCGQLFRAQRGPDLGRSRRDVPLSSGTPQQGFDAALGEPPAQVGGGWVPR